MVIMMKHTAKHIIDEANKGIKLMQHKADEILKRIVKDKGTHLILKDE